METTNAYGGVLSLQFAPHATAEDQKKSYQLNSTSVDTSEATEEELQRLHRIPGKIPWQAYTIAFAELCERFSYYGMSVVLSKVMESGAYDLEGRPPSAFDAFTVIFVYIIPLLGAYIAEEHLGRFNTILAAFLFGIIGHIFLVVSAIPSVTTQRFHTIGTLWVGFLIFGISVGCIKSNITPFIAEQYRDTRLKIIVTKSGERVILDPSIIITRIFMYYYFILTLAGLIGRIAMNYTPKNDRSWQSFLILALSFCLCPIVLYLCRNSYARLPPTGSVLRQSLRLWILATKGRWSMNPVTAIRNMRAVDFWENVKPSKLGIHKPSWITCDDAWVDEVRRAVKACTVFAWFPIYWLTYTQLHYNITSQAKSMDTHKAPNDFIRNIDAISLIIGIPLVDRIVFPFLLRNGIHFTAIKRIFSGFILVAFALTIACITQHYIYTLGPCGKYTEKCINENRPAPINFLVQMPVYLLLALSEIFAAVTGIEYAFTKAPKNMRSLVLSIYWLAKGTGILLAQAFTALNRDPLLVWNYGSSGVIAFVSAILFWTCHRKLDKEEDKLNMLPSGHLRKMNDVEMVESSRPVEMADSSPVEMADNSWPVEMPDNSWPVEMADSSQPAEVVDSMTSAEEEASVHVESKLKRTMTR